MRPDPVARLTLRFGDLRRGHLTRNLAAISLRRGIAAQSRNVEPLVRRYIILVDIAANAIHHSEMKQRFG